MTDHTLPAISQKKCTLCGLCVSACPESVLGIQDSQVIFENPQACTYCGVCEETCPEKAVRLEFVICWA